MLKFWWSRNEENSLGFGRQPPNPCIKGEGRGEAWRKDDGNDAQVPVSGFTWKYHHFIIKNNTNHLILTHFVPQVLICGCRREPTSDDLRVPASPPVTAGMDSSTPMTLIRSKWLKEDGWVFYISAFSAVLYCCFQFFNFPSSIFCYLLFFAICRANQFFRVCTSIKKKTRNSKNNNLYFCTYKCSLQSVTQQISYITTHGRLEF